MMGSTITDKLGNIDERKLYTIIINTGNIIQHKENILYVDIPKIILNRLTLGFKSL